MNDSNLYDLLLRSLDKDLSEADSLRLQKALGQSAELRKEQERLLQFRKLTQQAAFRFRPFFAGSVLHRLQNDTQGRVLGVPIGPAAFLRVAIPGIAAILLLLISIYFAEGSLSIEALTGVSDISMEVIEDSYWSNFES